MSTTACQETSEIEALPSPGSIGRMSPGTTKFFSAAWSVCSASAAASDLAATSQTRMKMLRLSDFPKLAGSGLSKACAELQM